MPEPRKILSQRFIAISLIAGFLFGAIAFRMLIPATIKMINQPAMATRYSEARMLSDAFYAFASTNAGVFPKSAQQLVELLKSERPNSPTGATWEIAIKDYLFFPPSPHKKGETDYGRLIFAEKLGHYRFWDGGHVVFVGGWVNWIDEESHIALVAKSSSGNRR